MKTEHSTGVAKQIVQPRTSASVITTWYRHMQWQPDHCTNGFRKCDHCMESRIVVGSIVETCTYWNSPLAICQ